MENCQQQHRGSVPLPNDSQESQNDCMKWTNDNNDLDHNAFTHSEQKQQAYEEYSYDCNENMESQDIFHEHGNTEHTTLMNDNDDGETFGDTVIEEMGRECLELQQDIAQKCSDIEMLEKNSELVKEKIEMNQKISETIKMELLIEQDSYDAVQKILNNEVEQIKEVCEEQKGLNNQMKNFLNAKFKVKQYMVNFKEDFQDVKRNAERILFIYQDRIDELKKILKSLTDKNNMLSQKKLAIITENKKIEEKLKSTKDNMEKLCGKLEVKYCQQTAILHYLKSKGDEEWSKYNELEAELRLEEERGDKLIKTEENEYLMLKSRVQEVRNEVFEMKNKLLVDTKMVDDLIAEKQTLNVQLEKLQIEEKELLQDILNCSSDLSLNDDKIEQLKVTLNLKQRIDEENVELRNHLEILQGKKNNLTEKEREIDNEIAEINETCSDLEKRMNNLKDEILGILLQKENFDCKRKAMVEYIEQLKNNFQNRTCELNKQKSDYEFIKLSLEDKIEEINSEIKKNENTIESLLNDVMKSEQKYEESRKHVAVANELIKKLENDIAETNNQFEIELSKKQNEIKDKEELLVSIQTEISENRALKAKLKELTEEIEMMETLQKENLDKLDSDLKSKLQIKQAIFEEKKKELELEYNKRKKMVSDLQNELIDEQKKELHLIKVVHKLNHINEQNKKELARFANVIKALDVKLNAVALTVTRWSKEKESTICSQATSSISIGLATTQSVSNLQTDKKPIVKMSDDDGDSNSNSSSGVSMNANDNTWKKKLLMKQQMKQKQSLTPKTSDQVQTSTNETLDTKQMDNFLEKEKNPQDGFCQPFSKNKQSETAVETTPKKKVTRSRQKPSQKVNK